VVGPGCYVGPLASLRGDFSRVILEDGCNVQDNCTLHTMPGFDLIIVATSYRHGVILHSAHIETNAMVGMNSVIMDRATVGESAIVAAMSFVKADAKIPARHLGRSAGTHPARTDRRRTRQEGVGTRLYHDLRVEALPR